MAARGAASLQHLGMQYYDADDGLPCADFTLIVPLKRSAEYAAIRRRVADPKPADAWQADGLHYFVFPLRPSEDHDATRPTPVALFTMRPGEPMPACAVVVTPLATGDRAEVVDLRQPGRAHTMPLSRERE